MMSFLRVIRQQWNKSKEFLSLIDIVLYYLPTIIYILSFIHPMNITGKSASSAFIYLLPLAVVIKSFNYFFFDSGHSNFNFYKLTM